MLTCKQCGAPVSSRLFDCAICGASTAASAAEYRSQELKAKQRITRRCGSCDTEISVKLDLSDRSISCPVCQEIIPGSAGLSNPNITLLPLSSPDMPTIPPAATPAVPSSFTPLPELTADTSEPPVSVAGAQNLEEVAPPPQVTSAESVILPEIPTAETTGSDSFEVASPVSDSSFDLDAMLGLADEVQRDNQVPQLFSRSRGEGKVPASSPPSTPGPTFSFPEIVDPPVDAKSQEQASQPVVPVSAQARQLVQPEVQHHPQSSTPSQPVQPQPAQMPSVPPSAPNINMMESWEFAMQQRLPPLMPPQYQQGPQYQPPPYQPSQMPGYPPHAMPQSMMPPTQMPAPQMPYGSPYPPQVTPPPFPMHPPPELPSSYPTSALPEKPVSTGTGETLLSAGVTETNVPSPTGNEPEHLEARCDGCHKRIQGKLKMAGRTISCPVCRATVTFPSLEQARSSQEVSSSRSTNAATGDPQGGSVGADHLMAQCGKCHKRIQGKLKMSGRVISCPVCRESVTFPTIPQSPSSAEVPQAVIDGARTDTDESSASPAVAPKVTEASGEYINTNCGGCNKSIRARAKMAGRVVVCPACRLPVTLPGGDAETKPRKSRSAEHTVVSGKSSHEFSLAISKACEAEPTAAESTPARPATLGRLALRRVQKGLDGYVAASSTGEAVPGGEAAIRELLDSKDGRIVSMLEPVYPHLPRSLKLQVLKDLPLLKDPSAFGLILKELQSEDGSTVRAALHGLGQMNDRRAVLPLLQFILTQPGERLRGLDALQKIEGTTPLLLETLDSSTNDSLTHLVIEALGRRKDPRSVGTMERFLSHRSTVMRSHTAEMLAGFGEGHSTGALVKVLHDPADQVRLHALTAIVQCPDPRYAPSVLPLLGDESRDVRLLAIEAIGACGDRRAVEALRPWLQSDDADATIVAAEALGRLGDKDSAPLIIAKLEVVGEDPTQQPATLRLIDALRRIGDERAVLPLINLLGHSSYKVRTRVAEALGKLKDRSAVQDLEEVLYKDAMEETKIAAAKGLGEIADPSAVRSLIEYGLRDTPAVRTQSVIALGAMKGDFDALNAIRGALNDIAPPVRLQAIDQLADLNDKGSVALLEARLSDPEEMVQRAAMTALRKLGDMRTDDEFQKLIGKSPKKAGSKQSISETPQLGASTKRGFRMSDLIPSALAGIFTIPRLSLPSWNMDSLRSIDSVDGVPGGQKTVIGASLALIVVGYFLWNWITGPESFAGVPLRGSVAVLDAGPKGDIVVSGRTTGMVEVWNTSGPSVVDFVENVPCRWLGCNADGDRLIAIGEATVSFVEISSGGSLGNITPQEGHSVPVIHCGFSANRVYAITCDQSGVVIRWNLKTGTVEGKHNIPAPSSITSFAVSPEGDRYVYGTAGDQHLEERSAKDGELLETYSGGKHPFTSLAYHPEGQQIAGGQSTMNGNIAVWESGNKNPSRILKGGSGSVGGLRFLTDGTMVVVRQTTIELWKEGADTPEKELSVALERVDAFAIAGTTATDLAVACNEASPIYFYDLATAQFKSQADVHR
ncbi:MAG: HEAT repeat domain-containing protein [Planctomycetaceae bacterium]